MDKQTESRSQFEAEFKRRHCDMPASRMNALLRIHNFGTEEDPEMDYYSLEARDAWEWWQKSRESLVVELPREVTHVTNKYYEEGRDDVISAIEAIGIRIKGEGV
ncbi:hypothetical protein [Serratia fonticola]